jgi:hypothetical protein
MNRARNIILAIAVFVVTAGVANAQEFGIGRYERVQILANDLESVTRSLYLREDRVWPRTRGSQYMRRVFYRLYNQASNFQTQLERNFEDRDRINLEYRRLMSVARETQYTLDRVSTGGYLYRDMQLVNHMVQQIGRNLYVYGERYRDDRGYDDDYNYDPDDYDYDRQDDDRYDDDDN